MPRESPLLSSLAILAALLLAACQTAPPTSTSSPTAAAIQDPYRLPDPIPGHYLYEEQIHPGMKGYGLTVMTGGKIERFNVDVIDVVKDFSPGTNAILVRCSGLGLEHSGIIAGMSGSPVYIDGKMIGAIAFGWGMAKDPIAGVQPIRQMLAINAHPSETYAAAGASISPLFTEEAAGLPGWSTLAAALAKRNPALVDSVSSPAGALHKLASPLMVSGMSTGSLELLDASLKNTGLVAIASGSAGATPGSSGKPLGGIAALKPHQIRLQPGSAIAVPLLTGDMDLSAIGTVTEVRDNRVYAFGHAFLAEGVTRLPIATSYIYTVMPNVNQSFKMGASLASAGTLVMDEQTGIVGILGAAPPTVPITVTVHNENSPIKIFHYQLAPHPKLTPIILNSILNETLVAQRQLPPQFTMHVTGEIAFTDPAGGAPLRIKIDNLGATDSFRLASTLLPVVVLAENPFNKLALAGVDLQATIEHQNKGAAIRSVTVDRTTVAPGDIIRAVAQIEPFRNETRRLPITVQVPADTPEGDYELLVGNSGMALAQEADYAPQRFDPQSLIALESAVQKIMDYSSDHLYARLVLQISGASVKGRERSNIPSSRLAIYSSDRRNDATPLMRVVTQSLPAGCVLETGGQLFTIHVRRDADQRYFNPKSIDDQHLGRPPASEPASGGGNE